MGEMREHVIERSPLGPVFDARFALFRLYALVSSTTTTATMTTRRGSSFLSENRLPVFPRVLLYSNGPRERSFRISRTLHGRVFNSPARTARHGGLRGPGPTTANISMPQTSRRNKDQRIIKSPLLSLSPFFSAQPFCFLLDYARFFRDSFQLVGIIR